jgi:hypothetical protein
MEMQIKSYNEIKSQIQDGDLIAWNGNGHNTIEWLYSVGIRMVTGPVTHCSMAVWVKIGEKDVLFLCETMALGTLFDSLDRRIAMAQEERWLQCWWFPLSEERREKLDKTALTDYLVKKVEEGTPYDIKQGIRSAFDDWGLGWQHNLPDDTKLFCSELYMFALQKSGVVKGSNPSEAHPIDVIKFDLWKPTFYQIYPNHASMDLLHHVPEIGTVNPDEWDD